MKKKLQIEGMKWVRFTEALNCKWQWQIRNTTTVWVYYILFSDSMMQCQISEVMSQSGLRRISGTENGSPPVLGLNLPLMQSVPRSRVYSNKTVRGRVQKGKRSTSVTSCQTFLQAGETLLQLRWYSVNRGRCVGHHRLAEEKEVIVMLRHNWRVTVTVT